jgi:acyl carrier protein
MDRNDMLERLRGVLQDSSTQPVDWAALSAETTVQSLGFDSLSILDVLYGIEQEFGVELEAGDVIDLETVGQLMDVMVEKAA